MRIQELPPLHLTYCLNVHPGETWVENFAAIREKALAVRDRVVLAGQPFGLGLRLGRQAADELAAEPNLRAFREFLAGENLYVFTINGFPYGPFHGTAVKENVYRPDWRSLRRLDYTLLLADILAELLPEGVGGSISTVPGAYKDWIGTERDRNAMVWMLAEAARHCEAIFRRRGREVRIALEPEPDCFLENTDDAVEFFTGPLLREGAAFLSREHALAAKDAEPALRRFLGVCLDTAHIAVQFEDPAASLQRLASAGVPVCKVQLSAALRLCPTDETLRRLGEFAEGVYLHQVKSRLPGGELVSYRDLPEALAAAARPHGCTHRSRGTLDGTPGAEWRVHFHVPLFLDDYQGLQSTGPLLKGPFAQALREGACEHLEIETYTFNVLPRGLRAADVVDGIAREYRWVLDDLLRR